MTFRHVHLLFEHLVIVLQDYDDLSAIAIYMRPKPPHPGLPNATSVLCADDCRERNGMNFQTGPNGTARRTSLRVALSANRTS